MKRGMLYGALALTLWGTTACSSHYQLSDMKYSQIRIDERYDAHADKEAAAFLSPYKAKVDSVMSPVIGRAAHDMVAKRPESDLSNLLSDILIWAGKHYGETPDVGIYNVGGIRATLVKGDVTYGDILDIAPFENKICFLTLNGEALLELFSQIGARGGEGISHGTELVFSSDWNLLSARINGKEINAQATYRVATLDYLAQGNDGLLAFKKGTNVKAPQDEHNNLRYIIMDYFKEKAARGIEVSAKVEGRIRVK